MINQRLQIIHLDRWSEGLSILLPSWTFPLKNIEPFYSKNPIMFCFQYFLNTADQAKNNSSKSHKHFICYKEDLTKSIVNEVFEGVIITVVGNLVVG